MRRSFARALPSPAMVVATVALFVGLGGSGYAASTLIQTSSAGLTWHPLALQNGWARFQASGQFSEAPMYAKDSNGFVHLRGMIKHAGPSTSAFAYLPAGSRPKGSDAWLPLGATNGNYDPHLVNLDVHTTGALNVRNGSSSNDHFVSLDGVNFKAG